MPAPGQPPQKDHHEIDERVIARIAPWWRRWWGPVRVLGWPLIVIGTIVGGRLAMPVKELKLAPLVPFVPAQASAAPSALVNAPMVAVPAGSFTMGSAEKNEGPPHPVTVGKFRMDPTEVTVADYRACVQSGRCPADGIAAEQGCTWSAPNNDRYPMNCVDWNEADIYCRWVGKRLPTEAEWEYAARGPQGRVYPWGNEPPTAERSCFERAAPCPVGEHAAGATPAGLHDLAGNVWEWTASPYCPYGKEGCDSVQRAVRGGSYTAREGAKLRSSARSGHVVTLRERYLGFRCVAD